jgi:hypothetical protein
MLAQKNAAVEDFWNTQKSVSGHSVMSPKQTGTSSKLFRCLLVLVIANNVIFELLAHIKLLLPHHVG